VVEFGSKKRLDIGVQRTSPHRIQPPDGTRSTLVALRFGERNP